jgi:hypothetical protein
MFLGWPVFNTADQTLSNGDFPRVLLPVLWILTILSGFGSDISQHLDPDSDRNNFLLDNYLAE